MSDQDFFFDEDEQPKAAAEKAAKPEAKKSAAAKSPAQAAPAAAAGQGVTTTVAALIGVIALLGGLVIGILLPIGGASVPSATPSVVAPTEGGASSAPQLSPEQMQGGELPAGHPDIGSMSGSTTGSADASGTGDSGDAKK